MQRKLLRTYRLKIVSFTLGDIRFLPDENEVIEINCPESKLKIRAEGIPNDLYYRMDALVSNGKFMWPVKEVLFLDSRTKIARNIGILAFLTSEPKKNIYVPVKVNGQNATADPNSSPLLKFVCTTKLNQIQWRVQGETQYRKLEGSSFRAYAPVFLRIPADVKGEKSIQIKAQEENSIEWIYTNVTVKI